MNVFIFRAVTAWPRRLFQELTFLSPNNLLCKSKRDISFANLWVCPLIPDFESALINIFLTCGLYLSEVIACEWHVCGSVQGHLTAL